MAERLKILAVDDEPNVTKMIKRLLVVAGYDVVELNDPLKVEEFILYAEFSLVITDLKMPGRDGLEVLRLVKESKPNLPCLCSPEFPPSKPRWRPPSWARPNT
jgi:CheY-like chemotaxis protein